MTPSWLHYFHLGFVAIALLSSASAMLFSSLYLVQQSQLKHKRSYLYLPHLPSLESLDRFAMRSILVGVVSVFILLISGIVLAHMVWKDQWMKDEKVLIAFFTWIWFLFTTLLRFQFGIRGGKFFYSVVIGFLFLVTSCLLTWIV